MSRGIYFLLLVIFTLVFHEGYTQRLGLLPPSTKWKQLRDDSLRIVYPDGLEDQAHRVASLMLKFAALDPITTKGRNKPITVLLQPHTNVANGYVGLAPYVSEFYLQPNENPFTLGSLPWADLLAVHEYRHVQQVNAANRGISHLGKVAFGELAYTALYNIAIPDWYREGDAVYAETKWTLQGRGRLSSFTLPFRMKMLEGEAWDFYKVRNGSYKEYTPDHYSLGYLLVQYGNHIFGESTWDSILQEAAQFKHLLSPFAGALKERTGGNTKELYSDAMTWYREHWQSRKANEINYPAVLVEERDVVNDYLDMNFPHVNDDGSIYTSITTFDHTTAIYKINVDGKRVKVVSMGLQQDSYFDYSAGKFVWTELKYDPRWSRKDRNIIVVYDEAKGNKRSIKPDKGFINPSLNKSANRIVALHVNHQGLYSLHILDAANGKLISEIPNPQNLYLGYPIWSADETEIISTARNNLGQMALVRQHISSGKIEFITHYSYAVLGRPVLHENWIFVSTSLDELDQVYAVDSKEGIFYKVSDGNHAHYDPAWDPVQDAIVSAAYHINGKKLVRHPGMPRNWRMQNLDKGIKHITGASEINLLGLSHDERKFDVSNYSPWNNVFNFHSLFVRADDPTWGIEVQSDNILNNISLAGGYEYNRNSRASGPYIDLQFGMWYPVLSLGVSQTSRRDETMGGTRVRQTNQRLNAGIALPLFYSSGVFQQNVVLSSTYNTGISKITPDVPEFEDLPFNYQTHRLILINSRLRAYRQPLPSWAQRADVMYSHEWNGVNIQQFYASGEFAFPAVKPSHYLLARGEFLSQEIGEGSIQLGSPYVGARGFDAFIGKKQYSSGVTYGFPIAYPDIGIGSILYTRRIRLQGFYDVAFTDAEESPFQWMRSAGVEGLIDFEFPPITLGLRYARLLSGYEGSPDRFEIFLPVQRF